MSEKSETSRSISDGDDSEWRRIPRREVEIRQVSNDGLSICYEASGDPDGDAIVFVEGWGVGRWMWRWQRHAFTDRFRAILPDNRGTGRSETPSGPRNVPELFLERTSRWWANWLSLCWPPVAFTPWAEWPTPIDPPFTISDMAGDLEAVLADADVQAAHVVGASMGGMIALQYALEYERAKTLSLLGSTPGGAEAVMPTPRVQASAVSGAGRDLDREQLRKRTRLALSDEFAASNPDVVERIIDWRQETDATPRGRFLQAVAATGFDFGNRLAEIRLPVHVLHGTADSVIPVENGQILAERLPNTTFTAIDDGSHFFFIERAEEVNEALTDFVGEHATG